MLVTVSGNTGDKTSSSDSRSGRSGMMACAVMPAEVRDLLGGELGSQGQPLAIPGHQPDLGAGRGGRTDELRIDIIPILLGSGIPLFGKLRTALAELDQIQVSASSDVTHLRYRIARTSPRRTMQTL